MKKVIFALLVIVFASCTTTRQTSTNDSFVIIDGKKVELFADEYGNGYMKQKVRGGFVYIPFVFPYADEDSTTKNK